MAKPIFDAQTKALLEVGYIRWTDFAFILLLLMDGTVGFFWKLFGAPTVMQLLLVVGIFVCMLMLWMICLIYRCMWFVLVYVVAELKTMPSKAAKLALAFASSAVNEESE